MDSIPYIAKNMQEGNALEFASNDDLPIASDARPADEDQLVTNKFKWPEFAGHQGERYLDAVLQSILPIALFRTWHNLIIREAPGQGAYAGVIKLAAHGARSDRKIYLDLERFRADNLVTCYKAYRNVPHADGTYRPALVTVKDFSPLYDLAHDYHLWTTCDQCYIAPLREHAEYILNDPDLFARLIRFECYRKVLLCAKPGPKRAIKQVDLLALAKEVTERDAKGAYVCNSRQKSINVNKQLPTKLPEQSLYRITSTDHLDRDSESEFSIAEKGRDSRARTIRSGSIETLIGSKTKRNETRNDNAAAGNAEGVLGYTEEEMKRDVQKRGAALAGVSAEHYRKLQGGPDQHEQEEQRERERAAKAEEQANRQERERPAAVATTIEDYVSKYDDPKLIQSDITRAYKIYFTAEEVLEHFNATFFWNTFTGAKDAAGKYASKHVNRHNMVNRVPYMFTCLENGFGFSLEELVYLRTEDPLFMEYSIWDVMERLRSRYQEEYRSRSTHYDYRTWLQWILDLFENRSTTQPDYKPKERLNPTIRGEFE